jgi:hypothetical protein
LLHRDARVRIKPDDDEAEDTGKVTHDGPERIVTGEAAPAATKE